MYMFHCHILEHEDDGMMTLFEVVVPINITQAASRKTHGSAGTFDIALPVTGNPGIECRSGGVNGNYTMVFTFDNLVTNVDGANVTTGVGSIASSQIDSSNAHNYIVNLTGVANAQQITVTLTNVHGPEGVFSSAVSVPVKVLIGDTTYNGVVNASDVSQTKAQTGQPTTSANFRSDINASGGINSSDVAQIKAQVGSSVP
jgi:hypothetical protein